MEGFYVVYWGILYDMQNVYKTLRHYAEIGLIFPSEVNPKNG